MLNKYEDRTVASKKNQMRGPIQREDTPVYVCQQLETTTPGKSPILQSARCSKIKIYLL